MNSSHQLSTASRLLMALASIVLVGLFFLPAWRIDLFAPQYPEGLMLNIWINRISGDVEIINGLNHYIGMKPFSSESFPEFKYLYLIVIFFMLFGLLISITGKSRLLKYFLILSIIGGCIAIYDFYSWGYEYGHDLDPKAAIQVPGLSYQPPVFGHKRLLNFDAYSFPDIGGWLVISGVAIAFIIYFYEYYNFRKKALSVAPIATLFFFVQSCVSGPEPIVVGKDACHHCKMTIVDSRFATEIITKQGKIFKFDDVICMNSYISNKLDKKDIKSLLVSDYNHSDNLLPAETATFYKSDNFKSPMGGNIIATSNEANPPILTNSDPIQKATWSDISK